jgi:PPM family protein phosphatase
VGVQVRIEGATDIGKRRKRNEDSWLALASENLVVIADGMGGHGGGDIASQAAVKAMEDFFTRTGAESDVTWPHVAIDDELNLEDLSASRLVSAIQYAHRCIAMEVQQNPDLAGMGTTIVCALFAEDKVYVAHVGDSRCYCFSDGSLWQVTDDHTLSNHVRKRFDELSVEQEQRLESLKHVVVRALGGSDLSDAQVDLTILEPAPGDLFLLCSDGLSGELSDGEIRETLTGGEDLGVMCDSLVQRANEKGGRDNITVALAQITPSSKERLRRRAGDRQMSPDDEDTLEDIQV